MSEEEFLGIDDSSIIELFEEMGGSMDDLPPPTVLSDEEIDRVLRRLFPDKAEDTD